MRPPDPDVHGHLRVVQGRTCSRCEVRFQGHDESPTRQRKRSTPTFASSSASVPSTSHALNPRSTSSTKYEPSPGGSSPKTVSRGPDNPSGRAGNPSPSGCPVRICAGTTSRRRVPLRTNADRAPSGSAMRSALPATRQAAGVPSAWSQPSPTHSRPRRWCDAGPLGRQSVTTAQKAGDEGWVRDSGRNSASGSASRRPAMLDTQFESRFNRNERATSR